MVETQTNIDPMVFPSNIDESNHHGRNILELTFILIRIIFNVKISHKCIFLNGLEYIQDKSMLIYICQCINNIYRYSKL